MSVIAADGLLDGPFVKCTTVLADCVYVAGVPYNHSGKDPAHVYPDRTTALRWLNSFTAASGLPQANMVVNSGYGWHVYWVLDEPLTKHEWKPYAETLKSMMIANGYIGDLQRVADAASILRPPGTFNVKGGQKAEVKVAGAKADIPKATMLAAILVVVSVVLHDFLNNADARFEPAINLRSRRHMRRILAQAVPGNVARRDPFRLEDAPASDRDRQDRRLGDFGQLQLIFRSVET